MGVYEVLVIVAFAVDFSSSFFERIRISISHSTSAYYYYFLKKEKEKPTPTAK
jgi:hypothetical protein